MERTKRYTITDIAKELGVTRQTIYYWIKKSWVNPKRDYRDYPVFTADDLRSIKKWQSALRKKISSIKQERGKKPPAAAATPAHLTHSTALSLDKLGTRPERAKRVEGLRVNPEQGRRPSSSRVEGLTWGEIQKMLYKS